MVKRPSSESIIALAGVFQAVSLVDQIARDGMADSGPMQASIASVFKIDADSALDVFGGLEHLGFGLRQLIKQLDSGGQRNMQVTQYALAVLQLAGKLIGDPAAGENLREGITQVAPAFADKGAVGHEVIAALAQLYQDNISQLSPRVMVRGAEGHLHRADNTERVRALLLSAIRAAFLWHQSGGTRLQIMWHRKHIIRVASEMLRAA